MKKILKKIIKNSINAKSIIRHRVSDQRSYLFSIDSPKGINQETSSVTVEGWIISKKHKRVVEMRVLNNGVVHSVQTGIKRKDVAYSHSNYGKNIALYSGFRTEFEYQDGTIMIEVKNKKKWVRIYSSTIHNGIDKIPEYFYNKDLAWNYAEHRSLLEARKKYFYEAEDAPIKYEKGDPRIMAIYLPQFHTFEENDRAWGKGFTEWTNVTSAEPRFIGHQQPVLPTSLGFYDLTQDNKLKEQIELAKNHGIYGFSFYYYWFSGKKIMNKPIETFINNKDWDFRFSICWANENWTKKWDGRESDIIISQEYKKEDPINFIKDVEHILNDRRYLTVNGKPVLAVYRPEHLDDAKRYSRIWREYFKKKFNKELYLMSVISFEDNNPKAYGFDVALDFAPLSAFFKNNLFKHKQFPFLSVRDKLLDVNFEGIVADYREIATNEALSNAFQFKTIPCVATSWDNDARKKGKGFVYMNQSPYLYSRWLENSLKDVLYSNDDNPLLYINAWNEWAEGAMMEPSSHLGYATLNTTARVFNKFKKKPTKVFRTTNKLAVIIHLYHIEMWPVIIDRLSFIEERFDIHISLQEKDANFDFSESEQLKVAIKIHKYIVPNRGRDVLPFVMIIQKISDWGYDRILKIHSKKTKHYSNGEEWMIQLLKGLLPDKAMVNSINRILDQNNTGLIGPSQHIVSLSRHMGANKEQLFYLLQKSFGDERAKDIMNNKSLYPFVGGTMFWCRMDTLKPLLELNLLPDDFQSEHGQLDGTLAHALERFFGVISQSNNKQLFCIEDGVIRNISKIAYTGKYYNAP